jgi:membrane protein DedA with SNARE-associated domain
MSQWLSAASAWFLAVYAANELPALFVFLLIEEAGVPLLFPGDTLIMAAGARPDRTLAGALLVLAAASSAAALGSSVLYALVRRGGRPLLVRYGRFLHLSERRVATMEGWFRRHGALAIVVGRLVPGLRTPTTVMAGLFGVPYRTFAPATAVAALLWAAAYYLLGALLQRQWQGPGHQLGDPTGGPSRRLRPRASPDAHRTAGQRAQCSPGPDASGSPARSAARARPDRGAPVRLTLPLV